MKKYVLLFPLTILITLFYFSPVNVKAAEYSADDVKTWLIIPYNYGAAGYEVIGMLEDSVEIINRPNWPNDWTLTGHFAGYPRPIQSFNSSWSVQEIVEWLLSNCTGFGYGGSGNVGFTKSVCPIVYVVKGSATSNISEVTVLTPRPPEPPEPEPGSSWLGDMWEWFLWVLGINDDYSGDIDVYITGGDRERMEYVTPTPSPTPTPYPSPTPYDLTINYPDGTTGTITGIPGSTTIINGGDTTNNYGSDFDIFAVDVQIGDGGTSNPKDGLNSVMEASNDYLKDIDISPVQYSFSIIPSDWFLFIGVLAALPFIAGFIMRLLK